MSAKLIPKDPEEVMVIRDVTPEITTLSVPFSRFGKFKIGGRATIVKLQSGALAIFSPVALTPSVKAKLASLGNNVTYLIAPDFEHHIFLSEWAAAFPDAKLIGPEGLEEKRAQDPSHTNLKLTYTLTPSNKSTFELPADLASEFKIEYVHSHVNKELAFLHIPTKTLIQADLIFNLPATEQYSRSPESATSGFFTKLFNGLQNTSGSATWQKRFIWFGAAGKDRAGFAESVKRIDAWDFDRMISCHGDVIEKEGKVVWRKVMGWFLEMPAGK